MGSLKPMSQRPDLSTDSGRLAFTRILNERLPRKRAIAQGLARDPDGNVLLCRLTYKKEWDLPGGVVDPGEPPAACVEREVREELGIEASAERLLVVNWLPPYRGWDDATLFLFALGEIDPRRLDPSAFLHHEIAGVHWVDPARLGDHVAPYVARMVSVALTAEHTEYLEDGRVREEHR